MFKSHLKQKQGMVALLALKFNGLVWAGIVKKLRELGYSFKNQFQYEQNIQNH